MTIHLYRTLKEGVFYPGLLQAFERPVMHHMYRRQIRPSHDKSVDKAQKKNDYF